jgi:THO complex subunit 2
MNISNPWSSTGNHPADFSTAKDRSIRAKSTESRHERSEGAMKPDGQQKKSIVSANGSDSQIPSSAQGKSSGVARVADEPPKPQSDEGSKVSAKPTSDSEVSPSFASGYHVSVQL